MQPAEAAAARRLTDVADAEFLHDLAAIVADKSQPRRVRTIAAAVAMGFRTWLRWRTRLPSRRLALYGRYCGPGHSGPGEPIDAVDAACRRHDRSYQAAAALLLPTLPPRWGQGCFNKCGAPPPDPAPLGPWLECLRKCKGKKPK